MAGLRQKLYWKAPYFVKTCMASWNARRLGRERFGADYARVLSEIADHDKWSPAQFAEYQQVELGKLIRHAARNVPYYQKLFAEIGVDPESIDGAEDLARLPILEKAVIRADPVSFVDRRLDPGKLITLSTSGTTGTPLVLYRDVWLNSAAFAYLDARWRGTAGMCRGHNASVSIGGHLVASPDRSRPPFWVHNRKWKQLYMSSYHLSPQYLDAYVDKLRQFRGEYIEGYPSSIYAVARHILERDLEPVTFKACFTTAETLFDYQREAVTKAFRCRTYDQYGCGEMAVSAAECKEGTMHISPEFGIVEVVDDNDKPLEPGQAGQLICTSLINHVQPFIRYRIGDIGALGAGRCSCGSPLPLLDHVEGRVDAVLITRDGRRVGRLNFIFSDVDGVVEAQIVQNDYDRFVIRVVPAKDYTDAEGQKLIRNLGHRVGEADIRVEVVDRIERTSAGKFKAVICNLPRT
ncbi:MAG: phenylacetate--CoA ligase family protein [Phycisphaerae bacterium]|nr:phenylacetate--CoA ligase family protein [Phycisphaerae bacterium]